MEKIAVSMVAKARWRFTVGRWPLRTGLGEERPKKPRVRGNRVRWVLLVDQ